jgi:uncharacterized membrane protein
MAEQTTRTTGNDAPLSAAKNPDPRAMAAPGAYIEKDDQWVGRTVSVNRPREELYSFWRDFTNLAPSGPTSRMPGRKRALTK